MVDGSSLQPRHVPHQRAPARSHDRRYAGLDRTFDLPADRLDLLDEQVTAPIVAQIDPVILYIEGQPKKRERDDDALDCVMRALRCSTRWSGTLRGGRKADRPRARAGAGQCGGALLGGLLARLLCRSGWARAEKLVQDRARLAYRATNSTRQRRSARDLRALLSFLKGHGSGAALLRPRAAAEPQPAVHLGLQRAQLLLSRRSDTALERLQRCRACGVAAVLLAA